MPQPREALDTRHYPEHACEAPGCGFRSDHEGDFAMCEAPGCLRERICDGCTRECDVCARFFCAEHIVETRLDKLSMYRCQACEAARLAAA